MTRSIRTLAALLLTLFTAHIRAVDLVVPGPHIRSSETELLDAVAGGARVSPTLRRLLDRLDASDVVVYLTYDRAPSPRMAGHISLLSAVSGRRYLRIAIDRRTIGCRRVAILGHELQHAVEIAEAPAVTSEPELAALYRRIGFRSPGDARECFDSVGAILAGQLVQKEVTARYTEFTGR